MSPAMIATIKHYKIKQQTNNEGKARKYPETDKIYINYKGILLLIN